MLSISALHYYYTHGAEICQAKQPIQKMNNLRTISRNLCQRDPALRQLFANRLVGRFAQARGRFELFAGQCA